MLKDTLWWIRFPLLWGTVMWLTWRGRRWWRFFSSLDSVSMIGTVLRTVPGQMIYFFSNNSPNFICWLRRLVDHCFLCPQCRAFSLSYLSLRVVCPKSNSKTIGCPDGRRLWIEGFWRWFLSHQLERLIAYLCCSIFSLIIRMHRPNAPRYPKHCQHSSPLYGHFWRSIWPAYQPWGYIGWLS